MGWAAFPVIFLGLALQGLLFNFGGLTTLGLNTFNMAAPAVLLGLIFRSAVVSSNSWLNLAAGLVCGGLAILISGLLVALSLFLSGDEFIMVAYQVIIANLPVAIIESFTVMFCVKFLKKVRPAVLDLSASQQIAA
jgi:cobalt/nickel transport system permease protein